MNVPLLIIGIVLLVVGGGSVYGYRRRRDVVFQIKLAETRSVKEIMETVAAVAGDIGPGSYNETLEVKGLVKCSSPLQSELKNEACAHYRMSVVREYEETRREWDEAQQREVVRTSRGSETVASNSRSAEFTVDDGSGQITILASGAEIDGVQVLDEFRPHTGGGLHLQYGGFRLSLGSDMRDRRTLGFRYEEWILPLNARVYVLGEVRDNDGLVAVRQPENAEKRFLISVKSEEQLVRESEGAMRTFQFLGYGGLGGGLLCLILSIFV